MKTDEELFLIIFNKLKQIKVSNVLLSISTVFAIISFVCLNIWMFGYATEISEKVGNGYFFLSVAGFFISGIAKGIETGAF